MKLAGVIKESIVDGPGIRFVIFSQGCPHNCRGCHNPATHSFEDGFTVEFQKILDEIDKNPLLKGVTFSGGEPFCQARKFADLAKLIKTRGLDIVTYTGYTFEQIRDSFTNNKDWEDLLKYTDILIDGPFDEMQKDLMMKFRGSKNQRILDVKKSLELDYAVNYNLD